jgi:hypothetical protein
VDYSASCLRYLAPDAELNAAWVLQISQAEGADSQLLLVNQECREVCENFPEVFRAVRLGLSVNKYGVVAINFLEFQRWN